MDSSLRELFGRAGPIRAVDRVLSGSPAAFVLRRLPNHPAPKTIDGTLALARRGMPMLRAKRAMEALLLRGQAFVEVPQVEDPAALVADLRAAGIVAAQPTTGSDTRRSPKSDLNRRVGNAHTSRNRDMRQK